MQDLREKLMTQSYALQRDFNHPDTGVRIRLERPGLVEHVLTMYQTIHQSHAPLEEYYC